MALGSPGEYSLWLSALVRQLAASGDETRLRDLCERLLGPAHSGAALSSNPTAELGLDGRKLLKEVGRGEEWARLEGRSGERGEDCGKWGGGGADGRGECCYRKGVGGVSGEGWMRLSLWGRGKEYS